MWRRGYRRGCKETAEKYGGCEMCLGRGYTPVVREEGDEEETIGINYCDCERGEKLCLMIARESMAEIGTIFEVPIYADTKDFGQINRIMNAFDEAMEFVSGD